MHDHRAAGRSGHDFIAAHGVAAQPGDAVAMFNRLGSAALQGAHLPAGIAQLPRHFATDAAGGAEDQCLFLSCRHVESPIQVAMAEVWARAA